MHGESAATVPARDGDLLEGWLAARSTAERLEARFTTLADLGPGAIALVGRDGIRHGSARLDGLLGSPTASLEAALRRLVPAPADQRVVQEAFERAWTGRPARCRVTIARADGSTAQLDVELAPLPHETEPTLLAVLTEPAGGAAASDDATTLDPLRAFGLHLAALAGDLQAPLGAYREHLAALAERRDLPEDVRESLGLYQDVTGQVLDRLARALTWGRRAAPRRSVELGVMARAVVEGLRATLPDGVHVRYELHAASPIRGAADQLHVALEHLVRNAAEALAGRGGTITIGLRPLDGTVVLTVADDGPGIPDSLRPHAFEPFSSSKSITTGLGLGLPIVRDIVTRHQGRVSLASSPAGTTVTLSFPPVAAAAASAGCRRVLLVDDHDDVRATFQAMLGEAGWDVATAASAEDALLVLDEHEVDALLVDVQMSGRDGLALLEALALWHPTLVPRVTLHTGYADEERVARAAQRHGITVLQKPCRRAELLAALDRAAAAPPATP